LEVRLKTRTDALRDVYIALEESANKKETREQALLIRKLNREIKSIERDVEHQRRLK